MHRTITAVVMAIGLAIGHTGLTDPVQAQGGRRYSVEITNLTNAQRFTPRLAATHSADVEIFSAGTMASPGLETLAESGDPGPLAAELSGMSGVDDIAITDIMLPPLLGRGATEVLMLTARGRATRLSLAAMLIPTNDAFVGLNTALPIGQENTEVYAYAYDAGTEVNDESCASLPGPHIECDGKLRDGADPGGGEGYITIHRGIQVRYSFSEGMSSNPFSSRLSPPGSRGLMNFQNLVGLVYRF